MSEQDKDELLTSEAPEREREKRRSYYINLLTQPKTIISFSVPKDKVNNIVDLYEISDREDQNHSITINKAIKEYVLHHHIPNPQARLDRLIKLGLPHKPKWQCCVPECKAKATVELFLKDFEGKTETFPVCEKHKHWKHERYKFMKAYKPIKP